MGNSTMSRWVCTGAVFLYAGYCTAQDAPPPPPPAAPPEAAPVEQKPAQKPPEQVIVSVKIIEFQATKGLETGLSAYFLKQTRTDPGGEVLVNGNAINNLDLTFPSSTAAGITVILDQITMEEGDIEIVLQALVDENKASILSRPRAIVPIPSEKPTVITTTNDIPYENTQVVGSTAVQITSFEKTGVTLTVEAKSIHDEDGDFSTRHDTYVQLNLTCSVREEGQRIVVALDDNLAGGSDFSLSQNAISVPEFIDRSITTKVWTKNDQVLMFGGLFRNSESASLSTVPWLNQSDGIASYALSNAYPGNRITGPLSTTIGNKSKAESRRELVFLVKTENWYDSYALDAGLGFDDPPPDSEVDEPVISVVESEEDSEKSSNE
jgi:hypothetical protein